MLKKDEVEVTCYSGYRLNEKPVRFRISDREYTVKKIIESSLREIQPEGRRVRYYKVLCESGEVYRLCFDLQDNRWYLL